MLRVIVLLAVLWQSAFELRVQLRLADGTPSVGVTVRAQQGTTVVGECVTEADGGCLLTMALDDYGDVPVLTLAGYTFGPYYGVEGTSDQFILWPETLTSGQPLGLVLDAPGAAGVVTDLNPEGEIVIPFWNGMSPPEQARAWQTQAAIINPPTATRVAPTRTPRSLTATPRPTQVPASRTPAPTVHALSPTASLSATPARAANARPPLSGWVIAGVVLLVVLFVVGVAFTVERIERR